MIINTYFKKRDKYLITYKSDHKYSQIYFFLTRKIDKFICKNCKFIRDKSLMNQTYVTDIRYLQ